MSVITYNDYELNVKPSTIDLIANASDNDVVGIDYCVYALKVHGDAWIIEDGGEVALCRCYPTSRGVDFLKIRLEMFQSRLLMRD